MRTIKVPSDIKGGATVVRWRAEEGGNLTAGQVVLDLETDAGLLQLKLGAAGRLARRLVPGGKTVPADTPLAEVDDATGATTAASVVPEPAAPVAAPATAAGAVRPILMPQAGQSMEEGTIVAWHVKLGDVIQKGQVIFELETDKATIEVEAVEEGRVARIVLPEGQPLAVLEPVAFLADNDADVDAYLSGGGGASNAGPVPVGGSADDDVALAVAAEGSVVPPTPATVTVSGRLQASPAARKLAAEQSVELSAIGNGRGPGGRIVLADVEAARSSTHSKAAPPAAAPSANAPSPAPAPARGDVVRRRLSSMRRAIAQNLLASKQNIPHFYMRMTFDAEPLVRFQQSEKAKYPCSINDVITAACALIIKEMPAFRSRIEGDELLELPNSSIGIAVGLDEGLVVPVVVAVEKMSLRELGEETKRIVAAARGGKIAGMGQGVFTISNLGMFGIDEFSAIINPPEAAILAVGGVREEVIVSGGTMRPGKVMTVTLSVDHRVVDGVLAAKFMGRLKEILEYPAQLA